MYNKPINNVLEEVKSVFNNNNVIVNLFDNLFSLVYDTVGSTSDRNCVILNNIHIDIMDYIQPASCTDTEFRKMWIEFEWENKVRVSLQFL